MCHRLHIKEYSASSQQFDTCHNYGIQLIVNNNNSSNVVTEYGVEPYEPTNKKLDLNTQRCMMA